MPSFPPPLTSRPITSPPSTMQNRNQLNPLDHPQVYISRASLNVSYIGLTHKYNISCKPARVTTNNVEVCLARGGGSAGAGAGAGAGRPVHGEGPRLGGEPARALREVEEPLHGVAEGPRRPRRGAPVQRVQGERAVRPRGQQEGQALQAGAQQVRRHDHGRVPAHVRRVQGAPPPFPQWRTPGRRGLPVRRRRQLAAGGGLAAEGRGHRHQGPRPVRELLGVLDDRGGGGHQQDQDGEAGVAVGAGAHGLRQRQQPGLRRRPHGLRLPVHPQERDHHRVQLPVSRRAGQLRPGKGKRSCRDNRRLRGRPLQRRVRSTESRRRPARVRCNRCQRQRFPVLLGGRLHRRMQHGPRPRCRRRRLRHYSRWHQVLDREELVGSGLGREGLHQDAARRVAGRGAVWHRHAGVLPNQVGTTC